MYIIFVNIMLILWALNEFGKARSMVPLRLIYFLQKSLPDFNKYLLPSIGIGFFAKDWRSDFLNQAQLWRSQIWDFRRFIFSSSQSVFSFFWLILSFIFFSEINSYLIVLTAMSLVILERFSDRLRSLKIVPSVTYFSLLVLFLELSFRNSNLLMQFLLDSQIVYFTTIDSTINLVALLCMSSVIGFFIPIQGWSLVITFFLFLNSQLSYLGFIFVVAGEIIGTTLFWFRQLYGWAPPYRQCVTPLLAWILAYVIGFLVSIYLLRQLVNFGNVFNQIVMLKWIYLISIVIFLAGLYLTIMIWGHFKSVARDMIVVPSDEGLLKEFAQAPSDPILVFIKEQLALRQEKLSEFKREMDLNPQSKSKIPTFVLSQFEAELNLIKKILT